MTRIPFRTPNLRGCAHGALFEYRLVSVQARFGPGSFRYSRGVRDFRTHFGDFGGRVWLGAAHQGPLPRVAADAAMEAVAWKTTPHLMTTERFNQVPARLRGALASVLGVPNSEVILSNGSSRMLHLLANGIPFRDGDEALVVHADFPSNRLPWIGRRGLTVRTLTPTRPVPTVDEVAAGIGDRTRVLCVSWVHSFSGWVVDLEAIGSLCRERGVWLVANVTQGVGARKLKLSSLPVDAAVGSGWKWLCGPYATGFGWIRPELLEQLDVNQYYWLSAQTADDLGRGGEGDPPPAAGARGYDVFGTANFFNFVPWTAAIELLQGIGIETIAEHDQTLVQVLLHGVEALPYDVTSPTDPATRSTLVFVSHHDPGRNAAVHRHLTAAGIDTSFRHGRIRLAPHLYNTAEEMDRVIEGLRAAG